MLIERLSKESGLRSDRLKYFATTASKRYYVFSIPKASGGTRQIAHPARPLKSVQRWLNSRYLSRLPVHDCAMAYRKGKSIRDNAAKHVGTTYSLRLDFKEFFPSFSSENVLAFLSQQAFDPPFDGDDLEFVSNIACRDGALTIGAPTSPLLTNAMMHSFDEMVAAVCSQKDVIFTRYADDLFFSTNAPNVLSDLVTPVSELAANFEFGNLVINNDKTAFLSKKFRRAITGLVLTPNGEISVGRARKREIKALVYQWDNENLPDDRLDYLKGMLSFVSDVEPAFIDSLVKKYGEECLAGLLMPKARVETIFNNLEKLDSPGHSS